MKRSIAAILCLLAGAAHAQLSEIEQRTVAAVKQRRPAALELLEKSVRIYTTSIDGVGAYGEGAHTDDQDLQVASIEDGAIRAAILLYRLTRP